MGKSLSGQWDKLVGQRLNVCYRGIAAAVAARDPAPLAACARKQAEQGADMLDVCAAGADDEVSALAWMVRAVQDAVDVPLVLDSADARALLAAFDVCARPAAVNALSVRHVRSGAIRDLTDLPAPHFVVSAYDPATENSVDDRIATLCSIVQCGHNIVHSRLIMDPLVYPLTSGHEKWLQTCKMSYNIKNLWREAGILCALGNLNYGLSREHFIPQMWADCARLNGFDWLMCDLGNIIRSPRREKGPFRR